jgi:homogentisate 1,2-dioxygenase
MNWFSSTKERKLRTMLGNIPFEYGDYLIIPRGIIYQIGLIPRDIDCSMWSLLRLFYTQNAIKNESGQHLEHSFASATLFFSN